MLQGTCGNDGVSGLMLIMSHKIIRKVLDDAHYAFTLSDDLRSRIVSSYVDSFFVIISKPFSMQNTSFHR